MSELKNGNAARLSRTMDWGLTFDKPIKLKNGREIGSLSQARDFMVEVSPFERQKPYWECAADLIFEAAHQHHKGAVEEAREQLVRSLHNIKLI